MRSSAILLATALLGGCMATQQPPSPPLPLHAQTYGAARGTSVRTLIVVINGDGTPEARADADAFASAAAREVPDSAAVALLRPGYADRAGHRSPGDRGIDTGDNYTADRIAAVGDAIALLRKRYPAAHTVLVGDTGGAAIAANLAGTRPALVDGLVLVACPCSLPEWRDYMEKRTPSQPWEARVASLDPLKTAGGIAPDLRAAVLVGSDDPVTPVKFSRAYAEALTLRGVATEYRIVPNRGHDLLNDPEVIAATRRLAQSLPRKI